MVDTSKFIPGLKLSEMFYQEAVKPILQQEFPALTYSAALVGPGSEVLGFDTAQSTDHNWGPRVQLFLREEEYENHKNVLAIVMSKQLPHQFHDFPTNFGKSEEVRVQLLKESSDNPVYHRVDVVTIEGFFKWALAVNPYDETTVYDWLTFPEQHLLSLTSGKVFHDGLGELERLREKFRYYPHDLWLYLLASQWGKIAQEEAFVGRCGDVGDELGSRVIANRLIQFLMKLCFLMEEQYAPYSKWFGTGFSRLAISERLIPLFEQVQLSSTWKEREQFLSQAYEIVAQKHNTLRITPPLDTKVSLYYDRPYLVIHADRFAEAINQSIVDEEVKKVAKRGMGSVDQFVDCTDLLVQPDLCRKLMVMFEE